MPSAESDSWTPWPAATCSKSPPGLTARNWRDVKDAFRESAASGPLSLRERVGLADGFHRPYAGTAGSLMSIGVFNGTLDSRLRHVQQVG